MAKEQPMLNIFVAARPQILPIIIEALEVSTRLSCAGTARDGDEAISLLAGASADIALIDFALTGVSGVKVAEFLAAKHPDIISVLLSDQGTIEHYRKAMLAGAREFVNWPIPDDELEFCLERVAQITRGQRLHASSAVPTNHGSTPLDSRIVAVAGGKGGVGTSFLAANLANNISANPLGFRTALVDFDLASADLAAILNLKPRKFLTDLIPAGAEIDQELIESIAYRVEQNLDLFPGPPEMETAQDFPLSQIPVLLECWRARYDVIVIDLGTPSSESAMRLLGEADLVVPVVVPDVLSIRATARLIRLLERQGLNEKTIQPVVNARAESTMAFDRISGHIGASVTSGVPASSEVRQLLDEGRLVTEANDAVLGEAVERWAQGILLSLGLLEGLRVGR